MSKTRADELIEQVLADLRLADAGPAACYAAIDAVVAHLAEINRVKTIAENTTGTISERLCEWGLKESVPDTYYPLRSFQGIKWDWLGDFGIVGYPLNVFVSVKSFKAKERLLVSGSGNPLAPTLGWGLFDAPGEFGASRLATMRLRGFLAIYMPERTASALGADARDIRNINGNPLVRELAAFPRDLVASSEEFLLGGRKVRMVSASHF